jgi:hypothetical protein
VWMMDEREEDFPLALDQKPSINAVQLYILMAIANGHRREREMSQLLGFTSNALRQGIRGLASNGLIQEEGRVFKSWRLTEKGIEALASHGWGPRIPPARNLAPLQRNETRITTTFGTTLKLALGGILGALASIAVIGMATSFLYWAGYSLILRNYIPQQLSPYIPLDNPLVDLALGFLTSLALFKPPKNRVQSQRGG